MPDFFAPAEINHLVQWLSYRDLASISGLVNNREVRSRISLEEIEQFALSRLELTLRARNIADFIAFICARASAHYTFEPSRDQRLMYDLRPYTWLYNANMDTVYVTDYYNIQKAMSRKRGVCLCELSGSVVMAEHRSRFGYDMERPHFYYLLSEKLGIHEKLIFY